MGFCVFGDRPEKRGAVYPNAQTRDRLRGSVQASISLPLLHPRYSREREEVLLLLAKPNMAILVPLLGPVLRSAYCVSAVGASFCDGLCAGALLFSKRMYPLGDTSETSVCYKHCYARWLL